MARVNLEDQLFGQARLKRLAKLLKHTDHLALGLLSFLWHDSQEYGVLEATAEEIAEWSRLEDLQGYEDLADRAVTTSETLIHALVSSRFLSPTHGGKYRIHGNDSQVESLHVYRNEIEERKKISSLGGQARAKGAVRGVDGKFGEQPAGIQPDSSQLVQLEPSRLDQPKLDQPKLDQPENEAVEERHTMSAFGGQTLANDAVRTGYRKPAGMGQKTSRLDQPEKNHSLPCIDDKIANQPAGSQPQSSRCNQLLLDQPPAAMQDNAIQDNTNKNKELKETSAVPDNLPSIPKPPQRGKPAAFDSNQLGFLVGTYVKAWQERYGTDARPDIGGKTRGIFIRLMRDHPPPQLSELLQVYCQMQDEWFEKKRHDVGTFEQNLNKVSLARAKGMEATNIDWDKVFGGKGNGQASIHGADASAHNNVPGTGLSATARRDNLAKI